MLTIGLIAEGSCDFVVLRFMLAGFLDDPDAAVNPLQPPQRADGTYEIGGWTKVLAFCASERIEDALKDNQLLVVHIDTDDCDKPGFDVSRRKPSGEELTVEEMVIAVREKLISTIGKERYARIGSRLVFAIAVESIECWLLPLYYTDTHAKKTINCINSLNHALGASERFTIDVHNKQHRYYEKVAKPYTKQKTLLGKAPRQPSCALFLNALRATLDEPAPDE